MDTRNMPKKFTFNGKIKKNELVDQEDEANNPTHLDRKNSHTKRSEKE